jgi:hypothetical protein
LEAQQKPWYKRIDFAAIRAIEREANASITNALLGVYDFSYAPYALGDCLTWQENILCRAIDRGYSKVRLCLVTDPWRPACHLQPHINSSNYGRFIDALHPALFSNPLVQSVQVFRDRYAFNMFLFSAWRNGVACWPSYEDHFNCDLDYISHKEINAFFTKHSYLPRLVAPSGYVTALDSYIDRYARNRYLVACNIRQSRLSRHPADVDRDSPLEEWHQFFMHIQSRYPEVLFLYAGGFGEWDVNMIRHPNVLVMRGHGFSLGHELAAVHRADMFIGTSSGFTAAATFSQTPYVITNMEPRFSRFNGVPVGEPQYPFAFANQYLSWEKETADFLTESFERVYHATKGRRNASARERATLEDARQHSAIARAT